MRQYVSMLIEHKILSVNDDYVTSQVSLSNDSYKNTNTNYQQSLFRESKSFLLAYLLTQSAKMFNLLLIQLQCNYMASPKDFKCELLVTMISVEAALSMTLQEPSSL